MMTAADEDWQKDYFNPDGDTALDGEQGNDNYVRIVDATDYASFIKTTQSTRAREYEAQVASLLKSGTFAAIRNHQYRDAATFLHYGAGFAQAAGDLADNSEWARKGLDILSAPDNPYFVFAAMAVPFIAQLFRNHQQDIEEVRLSRKEIRASRKAAKARGEIPPVQGVEIKIPFTRRKLTIPIRVRLRIFPMAFGLIRAQTYEPDDLTRRVFSDPKLQAALKKQKLTVRFE